ncbi:hypothetical protein OAC77_04490 [Reinekea forsetii]|nr:hypothetical protein [Reinekea forsetii]
MHQLVKQWGIGLLLSCVASLSLANSEWEDRLLTQLDEAATLEHQRFSFQQVSQSSKARNFAQFEPQQDPQWQLLEVDNEPASAEQNKKFLKRRGREQEGDDPVKFRDIVAVNSVELMKQENGKVWLSFVPHVGELADDNADALTGYAIMSALDQRLLELHIENVETFSPAFSIKISMMVMSFQFMSVNNQTVPAQYAFNMQGKIGGIKKLEVESSTVYSNYQRAD